MCFQMNEYDASVSKDTTDSKLIELDCKEFEIIKQERIEKRQKKMLEYIEFLNRKKN